MNYERRQVWQIVFWSFWVATATFAAPQIAIYRSDGERVSYQRRGETVIIRKYKKLTPLSVIENPETRDSEIHRVGPDIEMPFSVFQGLLGAKLASLDRQSLSDEERKLLDQYLVKSPEPIEDRKAIVSLTKDLQSIQGRNGFESVRAQIESELQCVNQRLSEGLELIEARDKFDRLLNRLLADMEGPELKQAMGSKSDGKTVFFNVLNDLAHLSKCIDLKGKPRPGTACITSQGAVFVRVDQPEAGWLMAGKDGKIWFDAIQFGHSAQSGMNLSKAAGSGPLGQSSDRSIPDNEDFAQLLTAFEMRHNGARIGTIQSSSPGRKSSFLTQAGRRELYALFPGMENRWFRSATPHPQPGSAYAFDGYHGDVYTYFPTPKDDSHAVVFVSKPPKPSKPLQPLKQ